MKLILLVLVIGFGVKLVYTAMAPKATGPWSKEVQLLWQGDTCGLFGKLLIVGFPIVLLAIIFAIF